MTSCPKQRTTHPLLVLVLAYYYYYYCFCGLCLLFFGQQKEGQAACLHCSWTGSPNNMIMIIGPCFWPKDQATRTIECSAMFQAKILYNVLGSKVPRVFGLNIISFYMKNRGNNKNWLDLEALFLIVTSLRLFYFATILTA